MPKKKEKTNMKYELKKNALINGEEVKEIEYDFDSLKGDSAQLAIRELQKRGIVVQIVETDPNYHAMLFALAAGLSFEDISALSLKDYNAIVGLTRDFFLED